jgi:predicted DNA-binding protein (MmcQ/YjbR family)
MTFEEFNQFCDQLPATNHVVQWGGADVWKVGDKLFAVGGWSDTDFPAITFKTTLEEFELMKTADGFKPAPYLASRGMTWLQIHDSSKVSRKEIEYYLRESHKIVAQGMSKKKQRELGLLSD